MATEIKNTLEFKGTQGAWNVKYDKDDYDYSIYGDVFVASTLSPGAIDFLNATLIAAAHAMFRELKEISREEREIFCIRKFDLLEYERYMQRRENWFKATYPTEYEIKQRLVNAIRQAKHEGRL